MNNLITNVCICVCFYNTNPLYLEECFKSIDLAIWLFRRKYKDVPVELHVMDDGSDNTETLNMFDKIMNEYKYIKCWKHAHNTTLSVAINDLNVFTPDNALVIYIDSDDIMAPNRLITQYEVMTKYDQWKDITLCASLTTNKTIKTDNLNFIHYYRYRTLNEVHSLEKNFLIHSTIAYRINHLREFDIKYDNNLKCTQDYDFFLNILSHKLKLLLIPDALVFYRIYPDAEKPDNLRDYYSEFMIIRHKYNNPVLWG